MLRTTRSITAAAAVTALCLALSGAPAHASEGSSERAVATTFWLPEVGDEVLTYAAHTRPHADGIIAILIGITDGTSNTITFAARAAAPGVSP